MEFQVPNSSLVRSLPLQSTVQALEPLPHLKSFLYPQSTEQLSVSYGDRIHQGPSLSYRVAERDDGEAVPAGAPWIIRGLFGEAHWCTRWVSSLCAADPAFFQHLTEQTASYIHYLCLIRLALLDLPLELRETNSKIAIRIRQTPRNTLLKELYNPYPMGLLNAIPKLGKRPLSKNDYKRLVRVLLRADCAHLIRHLQNIKPDRLAWIEEFPTEHLHPKLLSTIKKGSDYQTLKYILKTVEVISGTRSKQQLYHSLGMIRDLNQLTKWFQRQLKKLSFPSPPWQGNSWIVPITCASDLHKYANDFHNCLDDYTRAVLLGYRYFYYCLHGPSIVSLVYDPLLGWLVDEIKGPDNKSPKNGIIETIKRSFIEAGYSVHPLSDDVCQYDMLWHAGYE